MFQNVKVFSARKYNEFLQIFFFEVRPFDSLVMLSLLLKKSWIRFPALPVEFFSNSELFYGMHGLGVSLSFAHPQLFFIGGSFALLTIGQGKPSSCVRIHIRSMRSIEIHLPKKGKF